MRTALYWLPLLLLFPGNAAGQALRATTGPDTSICLGEVIHFDASQSTSRPGLPILAWRWDFDSMDKVETDREGRQVEHYFNYVGAYNVTLTVHDKSGESSSAWQRVEVLAPPEWGPTLVDRFEGGRSGLISKGDADFAIHNQWGLQWYFRLDNVAKIPVSLKIYGYGPSRKVPVQVTPYDDDQSFDENFLPYINYDFANPKWERLEDARLSYDAASSSLTLRHTFPRSPVYLAWSPPYLPADLDRFLSTLDNNRFCRIQKIGKSVEGRDLKLITLTDPAIPDRGKIAIWMVGQQHGYEMAGGPICEGIMETLLKDPARQDHLKKFVYNLLPISNPDAMAHGGFRYNLHDVDLNRNWDAQVKGYADRISPEPEVRAIQHALNKWVEEGNRLDLFVDQHCHTPLSHGLWLYPADDTLVGSRVFQQELEFANQYMNRKHKYSVQPVPTPGSSPWYVATKYSRRTGVLAYTCENPLLSIETATGEKQLTTPDRYRAIGKEWVEAISDYFSKPRKGRR